MSNTYRAVSERALALHGPDSFEAAYTATEERDELDAGHLEIVPRAYKVLVNNFAEGSQGQKVDLALPVETEAALLQGAILERVVTPMNDQPPGNASADEWRAYALTQPGVTEADLEGMGRDELRDTYGSTK